MEERAGYVHDAGGRERKGILIEIDKAGQW